MVAGLSSTVFVNEFHYDNNAADIGEFIEIANTSNTNLTGWSVVLYNGGGAGAGAPYATYSLSGSAAYTVVNIPAEGLQNGPTDGFALVNNLGVVVQFLSYEGTFTATSGPANGLTTTGIPVNENGSGTVGNSLQLQGTGSTYGDFTWANPATATSGAHNTAQTTVFPDVNTTGTNFADNLLGSDGGRDFIVAKKGNDTVDGRGGDDYLMGNKGDDTLAGGEGNDTLYGGTENDIIYGGNGSDKVFGDAGNDEMWGGAGADTFGFNKKDFGTDIIHDFEIGIDKLQFSKKVILDFATFSTHASQSGANVVIDTGTGFAITIENVTLASLTADHFLFV
jgi:Ca2+-binding RTX toxin-like protein